LFRFHAAQIIQLSLTKWGGSSLVASVNQANLVMDQLKSLLFPN